MKKNGFKVARPLLDKTAFTAWLKGPGGTVYREVARHLPCRWFFGRNRARRILFRAARGKFGTGTAFAQALEQRLNDLPNVIRLIGMAIMRKGVKNLYSYEQSRGIIVVPRGIVQNDLAIYLTKKLADHSSISGFPGLARNVLAPVALEAETLFFKSIQKGRDATDSTERGLLMGADPHFKWGINKADGHYFFGYTDDKEQDFNQKKHLKRFKSEMAEILAVQEMVLEGLDRADRVKIAKAFQG